MISPINREIVKTTIPALEKEGPTIARIFYRNMLNEHEELRNVFNGVNQARGTQPLALANTVLAAAKHIDDLSVLTPYVDLIAQKHRALQVKPEQYPIVGHYLLQAIKEILGNAATPEILSAWRETYHAIADIFIGVEAELYKKANWSGWKPFQVVNREYVAADVVEFTVTPQPGSGIELSRIPIVPGQYVTVNVHPLIQHNHYDALRHYSICSESKEHGIKFAVKLEKSKEYPYGLVSRYLHEHVFVGDQILMSSPAGCFKLEEKWIKQCENPLVLISSGVGATPLMAMLEKQIDENPKRPIIWIHSSRESNVIFRKELERLSERCDNFQRHIIVTRAQPRLDQLFLQKHIPAHADIYLCGSPSFTKSMLAYLGSLNQENVHSELFEPKMASVPV